MPTPARAYLITFRTYGTWLHGDGRYSKHHHRAHGHQSPAIAPSPGWRDRSHGAMDGAPVVLDIASRSIVSTTVTEVCAYRGWGLFAVNARTNHVHAVLSWSKANEQEGGAPMIALARLCRRLSNRSLTLSALSGLRPLERGIARGNVPVWRPLERGIARGNALR